MISYAGIHCEAFDDVLLNAFSGPLPEDDAISGTNAESYGNNHVEVIIIGRLLLKFGISEFLSTGLWKLSSGGIHWALCSLPASYSALGRAGRRNA